MQQQQAAAQQQMMQQMLSGPCTVLMRGLPLQASTSDVLAFFHGFPDLQAECVQIQRNPYTAAPTGDALITFHSRPDAERAVQERNNGVLHQRSIQLFVYV